MSSLYRTLLDVYGRPPTEDEMVAAERRTLDLARKEWRFDDKPALELLAHLQHYGAPTRLLDVTVNPLIALWFAVEERTSDNDEDARLFAFITGARSVSLNADWGSRHPRWYSYKTDDLRRVHGWGTGKRRRLWRPPAYNERISAQNAGFILDGAPIAPDAVSSPDELQAPIATMRNVASINLRFSKIERDNLRPESAPVFTLKIKASAKAQMREQLERRFGYRASSIYSDLSGLAQYLGEHPDQIAG